MQAVGRKENGEMLLHDALNLRQQEVTDLLERVRGSL
jgi:hypothetical protein